jgi:hypothetical protein
MGITFTSHIIRQFRQQLGCILRPNFVLLYQYVVIDLYRTVPPQYQTVGLSI